MIIEYGKMYDRPIDMEDKSEIRRVQDICIERAYDCAKKFDITITDGPFIKMQDTNPPSPFFGRDPCRPRSVVIGWWFKGEKK